MSERYELFAVGEQATWRECTSDKDRRSIAHWRKGFGDGPFYVVEIRWATEKEKLYHPQLIILRLGPGEENDLGFSGYWLIHTRH